jgi:hypothetical protein
MNPESASSSPVGASFAHYQLCVQHFKVRWSSSKKFNVGNGGNVFIAKFNTCKILSIKFDI